MSLACLRSGSLPASPSENPSAGVSDVIPLDLGLMWPYFPSGYPPTAEEVELGKALFCYAGLSTDYTISCVSCHKPAAGFADPRTVSTGVAGQVGSRNSPTLLNVVFFDTLGWDGQGKSLEDQALRAITNPREMALERAEVELRVRSRYGATLKQLYDEVSARSVARALAAFQRTLIAGDSPFDRYVYAGDESAISESAKRGFALFLGKADCIRCHFMRSPASHPFGGRTAFFTDDRFHNTGIGFDQSGYAKDWGRFNVSGQESDRGAFKTPTLRNVALTSPYMHDGSLQTLEEVVDHYDKGGVPNPYLDADIRVLNLSKEEKHDLVEFMMSLTTPDTAGRFRMGPECPLE